MITDEKGATYEHHGMVRWTQLLQHASLCPGVTMRMTAFFLLSYFGTQPGTMYQGFPFGHAVRNQYLNCAGS